MSDDSVVEDSVDEPISVEDVVGRFLGPRFYPYWRERYGHEEESIAHALRKQTLVELERVLAAFNEVVRRRYSEEELEAFFDRIHCTYYPPGAGKTHIAWFQWVRDLVARGVDHKRRACQSLSERADSKMIARELAEPLPREQWDPTFRSAADWMGSLFFRGWRSVHNDADAAIEEMTAQRPTENLATALQELDAFLSRTYTEDELEYLVHTVLECCQFDPIPSATYTERLEWTQGRLRAALERKRAAERDKAR